MNYNPMLDYQRNNLLAQQQMIQSQLNQLNSQRQAFNPYPNTQQDPFFVKQVGSVDEAKGYPVDPSTIYLFPDTGTGKIYLKRLNTDNGKSELIIYSPETVQADVKSTDPMSSINERLGNIELKLGGLYESVSEITANRTVNEKSPRGNATADVGKNAGSESSEVPAGKGNAGRKE